MSYIKKTLTEDEKIILIKKCHWIFWFSFMPICLFAANVFSSLYLLRALFIDTEQYRIIISMCLLVPSAIGLLCYLIKYKSTENAVTDRRVIFKTGFIRTDTDELRNERIENIQIRQSIMGRILKYGDLEFKGTGGSPVIFKLIPDPIATKKEIENIIF